MSKINIQMIIRLLLSSFIFFSLGCKKMVEVDVPTTNINAVNAFQNDATSISVLTSIYTKISDLNYDLTDGSLTSISLYTGLSGDELTLYNINSQSLNPFFTNSLTSTISSGDFWDNIYSLMYTVNSTIEGLNSSSTLTPVVKQQLLGEAKFIRAFFYFYLTNLYGNVPLVLSTDYQKNSLQPRASIPQVYDQIIMDLKDAEELLSINYLKSDLISSYPIADAERIRPTKWAASALLARVYLFTRDYVNAEVKATEVIDNSSFYNLSPLNNVFLKNSSETIWSLQPVRSGLQSNTGEGALFLLPATGPNTSNYPVYLSNSLVQSFEQGDQRKINWVDSIKQSSVYYYPKKYKIGLVSTTTQEYIMMLRLAEVFLIRAEARAQQNKITDGEADLNAIRTRAGLGNVSGLDKDSLLTVILHERQVELFTEWGHRWFDLKRTSSIDEVMNNIAPQKNTTWNSYKALYPIPVTEITHDPNLDQNSGY